MEESFNEKCDRVLKYLKDRPSPYVEITRWETFVSDTGIDVNDSVLEYLRKDKKFIDTTKSDVSITAAGAHFISNNSFHQEQQDAELTSSLLWYNQADAKQRFDDFPVVKRQRDVAYVIAILTIILSAIALIFSK